MRKRILISLNIDLVVQHLLRYITEQNTTKLEPVYDEENPIGSTAQMRTWHTTKPNCPATKSHISHVVGDSSWEQYAANVFESNNEVGNKVIAYAKNDHLGFQIHYLWQGSRRRYIPDFIVKLANGKTLALEIKGEDSPQNKAKRDALAEWVAAINSAGGFGEWAWDVAFEPSQVQDIVLRLSGVLNPSNQIEHSDFDHERSSFVFGRTQFLRAVSNAPTAPDGPWRRRLSQHDIVRLRSVFRVGDRVLARGSIGAIVDLYRDGLAYEVEFAESLGATVTVPAEYLEKFDE